MRVLYSLVAFLAASAFAKPGGIPGGGKPTGGKPPKGPTSGMADLHLFANEADCEAKENPIASITEISWPLKSTCADYTVSLMNGEVEGASAVHDLMRSYYEAEEGAMELDATLTMISLKRTKFAFKAGPDCTAAKESPMTNFKYGGCIQQRAGEDEDAVTWYARADEHVHMEDEEMPMLGSAPRKARKLVA